MVQPTHQYTRQATDTPAEAAAEDGIVVLDGPSGIAASFTPDAAERTAENLIRAAAEARRQAR